MDSLTVIREQLEGLLNQITEERAELEERERATAAAAEQLSQEIAVQAAWRESAASMKGRVLALIDNQIAKFAGAGLNAMALASLRRQVLEVEG
jgi:predicted  nucleic acid-binding Zn-ribbon protein